jgi:ABC-type proline/glycine betaine transport system permease subunit
MLKFSKRILKKIRRFRKDHKSNLNIFLIFLAVVMLWKWVQDLLTILLFPKYPIISSIICIVIWLGILLIDDGKIDELSEPVENAKQ